MTMMDELSNYFLLLEIDPNAPWDEARFQQILRQKQSQWSSESMGVGTPATRAQKKKELIPEITRVMSDPTQRAAHARTARSMAGTLKQRRFEEFEQRLRDEERKGFLEQTDIDRLVREFQDIVSEAEIRAQARVSVREAEPEPEVEAPPQLESVVLEGINELLTLIKQPDLYHLLALPATSASVQLTRAAQSLYDELLKRQPKTSEVNALLRLVGHARTIFQSEELRQQYDEALRRKAPQVQRSAQSTPQSPALEEIKDLKCQNLQTALRLTWTWPDGCNEVRLSYSVGGWPEQGKQADATLKVVRAEYEAQGHYDLPGAWYQRYFISVATVTYHNGRTTVTQGARIESYLTGKVHITYEVKNPRFGHKQHTLHIYTKTPGVLPTLLMIGRRNAPPIQKSDGTLLHRIEGPIPIANELIASLAEMPFQQNTFVRLFLEDDALYNAVRIDLPADRKVRID